ncbi:ABC transporter permease [Thermotoga sp. 38H-to]|uniref:ABC transporter permease n=1 Tax=Thermotoga sp. 38H-to TaxID=1755812 RepID=UPI0013ECC116|nr:ABC transporter permease [Thermotoga sp. 38H-to]KAF2960204.1 peptide ABC transporter permease [Thermotoga sp. 38H-to]
MTRKEFVHFFLKNKKVIFAICVYAGLIILALVGPYLSPYKDPLAFVGPGYQPPSKEHWLGTNTFGQDIFTQLVYGLRSSLFVGVLGGTLATVIGLLIGFVAGYKGGWFDELLMMFTNILMVIPTLALLIIIAAYLPYRGVFIESIIIGFTAWPWTARAVRAQTLSLKTREFVDLARITARKPMKIIFGEIMPNMMSYVFMVFILQFGGAILAATGLDFIGLGPTRGISLGIMMQQATLWNAIQLGMWWWAITPGAVITLMVATLYVMNAGLDEVFNPKLREM